MTSLHSLSLPFICAAHNSTKMDADHLTSPEPLFRPVKRRKFVRRRPDHESDDISGHASESMREENSDPRAPESQPTLHTDEEATQTAGVIRLRRPPRARKGGIEFSTSRPAAGDDRATAPGATADDLDKEKVQAMCDRFTAHTGQMVDVDKHMYGTLFTDGPWCFVRLWTNEIRMAYIDSEMAKRYQRNTPKDDPEADQPASDATSGGGLLISGQQQREPASLGKLHEIDLGQETKLYNIARTEEATRRLAGDDEEPTTPTDHPGQEGKPWRYRKRRTSADIERDRLVEEVLRESKRTSHLDCPYTKTPTNYFSGCLRRTRGGGPVG